MNLRTVMKNKNKGVLVSGAGGFIGGHLVSRLHQAGFSSIRAVDIKPLDEWHQIFSDVENLSLDLRNQGHCSTVSKGVSLVFNLAADMGGMGYIEHYKAACMLSVLINTHLLMAARDNSVERYFFSSTACVYNSEKQESSQVTALKECDAYPAMPEDGYGWEKLFGERMCRHFSEDYGLEVRIGRYHNVYGPYGTWDGGREKAPAAICRKVIEAKLIDSSKIEIWGDGHQTRSFMYIDDCIDGTLRLMESEIDQPLNIGSDRLISINKLVDLVESIAGVHLDRRYILDAPQGVRGRNSDNSLVRSLIDWEPRVSLEEGIEKTYHWILEQMSNARIR